jgi:alpha-methylacyl-CoA racemase
VNASRTSPAPGLKPLKGITIVSLALNLPGPAALMRCRELGARCRKIEPPAPENAPAGITGDPMSVYNLEAYKALHQGIGTTAADLKTEAGQRALHRALESADVLLTSYRPAAHERLGLAWKRLHKLYPALHHIAIVGGPGALANQPGHDLTYLAENDLITGLELPATLYADMGGALMTVEAIMQVLLHRGSARSSPKKTGVYLEVPLSGAASWLAQPRSWGLTKPGAAVGGGHAGYRVYPCRDGRVAVAALEPHFAARLCEAAGLDAHTPPDMFEPDVHRTVAAFLLTKTRKQLAQLAAEQDIPLHTLSK